jgi:hypothetical protein
MADSFFSEHKTTDDINKSLGDILSKLKKDDTILGLFEIGLLDFFDINMLSDRQIAKKITSYSINPLTGARFSDKELNYMFYGQDLAADKIYINNESGDPILTPNPGYMAYFTETEDMVTYGAGYEPVDIRDMIKNLIHDIKKEVRKEIRSFEDGIKEMIHSIPKAFEQISGSAETVALMVAKSSTPVIGALAMDPGMFTKIAIDLHNAGTTLRKVIKDALKATLVLQTLNAMTIGPTKQINVTNIIKPAINGAPAIKKLIKAEIDQIPKIKFLIPDEITAVINDIVFNILLIIDTATDALLAIDTAAVAAELLALTVGPPPDGISAGILAIQLGIVMAFGGTLQTAISSARTAIDAYVTKHTTKG